MSNAISLNPDLSSLETDIDNANTNLVSLESDLASLDTIVGDYFNWANATITRTYLNCGSLAPGTHVLESASGKGIIRGFINFTDSNSISFRIYVDGDTSDDFALNYLAVKFYGGGIFEVYYSTYYKIEVIIPSAGDYPYGFYEVITT